MGQGIRIRSFEEQCFPREFFPPEIERDEFLFGDWKSLWENNCVRQLTRLVCNLYLPTPDLLCIVSVFVNMIAGHHFATNTEAVSCDGKSITRAVKPESKFIGGLA